MTELDEIEQDVKNAEREVECYKKTLDEIADFLEVIVRVLKGKAHESNLQCVEEPDGENFKVRFHHSYVPHSDNDVVSALKKLRQAEQRLEKVESKLKKKQFETRI